MRKYVYYYSINLTVESINVYTVVPHGVAYDEFKAATESAPPVMQISPASIAIMFESSRPFTITDYAWNSNKKHEHEPKMWDNLVDNFSAHQKEIDEILAKQGEVNGKH
jgi:homogentisate 1,2-dioxygenase